MFDPLEEVDGVAVNPLAQKLFEAHEIERARLGLIARQRGWDFVPEHERDLWRAVARQAIEIL